MVQFKKYRHRLYTAINTITKQKYQLCPILTLFAHNCLPQTFTCGILSGFFIFLNHYLQLRYYLKETIFLETQCCYCANIIIRMSLRKNFRTAESWRSGAHLVFICDVNTGINTHKYKKETFNNLVFLSKVMTYL